MITWRNERIRRLICDVEFASANVTIDMLYDVECVRSKRSGPLVFRMHLGGFASSFRLIYNIGRL